MELIGFINKYKNILNLNVVVIILSMIIASNIYKSQAKIKKLLMEKKDMEIKKNVALGDIKQSEEVINAYKNFLNQKDIALAINTISSIAKGSDVKIISFNPGTKADYPVYIKYPFVLSIEADSYHAIGGFISKLESHNDVYMVEGLNMKSLPESSGEPPRYKLAINLIVSTIIFKD